MTGEKKLNTELGVWRKKEEKECFSVGAKGAKRYKEVKRIFRPEKGENQPFIVRERRRKSKAGGRCTQAEFQKRRRRGFEPDREEGGVFVLLSWGGGQTKNIPFG